MIIFDEDANPVIFDSIYVPTPVEYFYVLDLEIKDFTLAPLYALEEIICSALKLEISGFKFYLPTTYFILVFSDDTSQVDSIKISDLTGSNFSIASYGVNHSRIISTNASIIDYVKEHRFIIPFLNKNQMVCHPIAPYTWIHISSYDQYSKYLKNTYINDFII